jgi:uncharacterized protein YkwD
MRHFCLFVFAAGSVGSLALAQAPENLETVREAFLKELNVLRAAKDVRALKRNPKLDEAAQKHAENLAAKDKFGDDGKDPNILDGKKLGDRLQAAGYEYSHSFQIVGMVTDPSRKTTTAQHAANEVKEWAKGANGDNLVDQKYSETGIGVAKGKNGKWFYCGVLATPKE